MNADEWGQWIHLAQLRERAMANLKAAVMLRRIQRRMAQPWLWRIQREIHIVDVLAEEFSGRLREALASCGRTGKGKSDSQGDSLLRLFETPEKVAGDARR